MRIVLELARQFRALDTNDTWQGYSIAGTVPHSPQTVLELPDEYDAAMVDLLVRDWVGRGLVVDKPQPWRVEHSDYAPLWLPNLPRVYANVEVGDTFPMIGVTEETRRRGKYGAGVIVALVDTGCDFRHSAFQGKTVGGDMSGDSQGHGTWCASHAASAWGVASDAQIFMKNGLPGGQGSEALIANCIRACVDHIVAARAPGVISLSLGGSGSALMDDACSYARARGVLTVAAAGNSGPQAPIGSPARACDLIVCACDRNRNFASFSSGTNWPNYPNRVTAVGVDVASAAANSTPDGVLVISGTSMATPAIAGHVALLLAGG